MRTGKSGCANTNKHSSHEKANILRGKHPTVDLECPRTNFPYSQGAGITVTAISYDEEPTGQKGRIGFVWGGGVEIGILRNFFSVQPELLFIPSGDNTGSWN